LFSNKLVLVFFDLINSTIIFVLVLSYSFKALSFLIHISNFLFYWGFRNFVKEELFLTLLVLLLGSYLHIPPPHVPLIKAHILAINLNIY